VQSSYGSMLNFDPTKLDAESATKLELSPAGSQHHYWGRGGRDYLAAMAETTLLRDQCYFSELDQTHRAHRFVETIECFVRYLASEDSKFCRIPEYDSYRGQTNLISLQ
jgi:hypothetical protein